MELIRNHRIYEDFIDKLNSDDLQSVPVEIDDDVVATNYIRIVVNGINTNNPLRKDYKLYIDAIKKFDKLLRKSFSMIPYIRLASNDFCIILDSKKNLNKYDEFTDKVSGLKFKNKQFDSVEDALKDASEFLIEYKANINVPGASWVRFMINFYEIGTACAKKCFMGGKFSQYNMDPTNYLKDHGMFVWYDKIQDVIHRKNDESTRRYVINFGKLVTGNNYKDYVKKWFEGTAYTGEQKLPPFVYSVLKRFRLDYNNVFVSISEQNVIFVEVPKDQTMETENASLKFMLDQCKDKGYRMFFTINGTLKCHMSGDNLVWKDKNNPGEKVCPFAEFFQHCVYPNVNIIRIDWYNPVPASFRCYDAVDFSMLFIKELYVKFGKYTPTFYNDNPKYIQPVISLNSEKPKIIKITDENKKTGTK